MKTYEIILKGASISMFGLFLSKLISYATIIIVSKIGSENFGLLNLSFSVISFLAMIFLLGLNSGVLRYVSYYLGKNDKERIKGTVLAALKICGIIGVVILILLVIFSNYIAIEIFKKPELASIIRILALMMPLIILTEIFVSTFLSYKKIEYTTLIRDISEKIVKLILIAIFLSLGFGLIGITLSYVISALFTSLLLFYFLRKDIFPVFDKRIKAKYNTKELLLYSLPLIMTGLLTMLQKWADTFILGIYRTASEVGVYNIAFSSAALLVMVPTALMSLFTPVITNLYGRNKIKEIRKISIVVTKWIFMGNMPLFIFLVISPKSLLKFVFSTEYASGYSALTILAVAYVLLSITHVYVSNLLMVKKTKLISFLVLMSTLVNIILNILLIPKYGINGAALATLVSSLVFSTSIAISAWFAIRLQTLNFSFIKIILAGILSSLIMVYIHKVLPSNLFFLIVSAFLSLIIYILILFLLKCLSKEDIEVIKYLKKKIVARLNLKIWRDDD